MLYPVRALSTVMHAVTREPIIVQDELIARGQALGTQFDKLRSDGMPMGILPEEMPWLMHYQVYLNQDTLELECDFIIAAESEESAVAFVNDIMNRAIDMIGDIRG